MSGVIPASLLNMRIHSFTNLGLGVVCFIFQIASLASAPHAVYEQIGIGFWGGLILIITAVVAYRSSTGDAPFLLGCSFVLSIFSFLVSFSIMCIFAAAIDEMNRYRDTPCTGEFIVPPNKTCSAGTTFPIPPCSYYSSGRMGFDSILLICGIIGIPMNVLLILSVITVYNPSPTPA